MCVAAAVTAAAADVVADIADRTELEAWVEIQQPEELEVLLMAVHYWDSLKSQTSLWRVVGA